MGIEIDEKTKILYGSHVIDVQAVAEDYDRWEGACRINTDATTSDIPEEELVLRDILDAPIKILRDANSGDLVLQAIIARHNKELKGYERPYTSIILTPVKGAVSEVRRLEADVGHFLLKEATPSHVAFDKLPHDLEIKVNYKGE